MKLHPKQRKGGSGEMEDPGNGVATTGAYIVRENC